MIMRERVIGMSVMWIAVAVAIGILVNSIRYTEYLSNPVERTMPDGTLQTIYEMSQQVVLMPGTWQFAVAVLIFFLVVGAIAGTISIWDSIKHQPELQSTETVRKESEKMKRDRQARVRRLLENMDEDDLAALENGQVGDDGERLSLQELMRR
jgi:hypothetical protein